MPIITEEIKYILKNNKEVDQNERIMVNFSLFNASSVDFIVDALITNTDWVHFVQVKHDILLAIADIIEKHGAEIAFPTRTVHIEGE